MHDIHGLYPFSHLQRIGNTLVETGGPSYQELMAFSGLWTRSEVSKRTKHTQEQSNLTEESAVQCSLIRFLDGPAVQLC